MKKIMSCIVCLVLVFGVFGGLSMSVSAATPTVTQVTTLTLKVGQQVPSVHYATIHNLFPMENFGSSFVEYGGSHWVADQGGYGGSGGVADSQGNLKLYTDGPHIIYKPGDIKVTAEIWRTLSADRTRPYSYELDGEWQQIFNVSELINLAPIKVEDPVITHNAPSSIKTGSTLAFTTAITNTAYTNSKVKNHKDNMPFYTPKVEIVEGKDLVTQSNQDYTNTLNTSENLIFNKAGSVKIKVIYSPTVYSNKFGSTPELKTLDGNVEKIITINVTGDSTTPPTSNNTSSAPNISVPDTSSISEESTSSTIDEQPIVITNEETGIKVGTQNGIIPDGAILIANAITAGDQFDKVNLALKDKANKFSAFDIYIEHENIKIQPSGQALVSIPIPAGYDRSRLAVYHISDTDETTELKSTVDSDSLTFETDHFSIYAVAEKAAAAVDTEQTKPIGTNGGLWWLWVVIGVVGVAGAGVAVWFFKFKKKPTEN